ncbi:MAG: ribosome maturation factor RimP [Erysipelotrichaceae bacterium]|jgi:ribosome maturation factor RimP|nr:ribosome maturation factor RimP [Erysipelotrichaceae bacterium]
MVTLCFNGGIMDINLIQNKLNEKLPSWGYELCSLTYKKEMGKFVLAVVVDRVEPIDMNAIVDISEKISAYLDEIDNSDDVYTLDVSSLGAEKPLKVEQLHLYVGRYVNVHLINPIDGENIYEGEIKSVNDNGLVLTIRIKTRVKDIDILFNNIYNIRLAVKF